MKKVFIEIIIFFYTTSIFSQCFTSPGNPIAGTSNLGTVEKKLLRMNFFYRYSESNHYFEGNKKSDFIYYDKAFYNYTGNIIAYGLTRKITIESEVGYFINKTIIYNQQLAGLPEYKKHGVGFTHSIISLKTIFYNNTEKRIKFSGSAGAKVPFTNELQQINGIPLPIDAQPSTICYGMVFQTFFLKENSFKAMRYFYIGRYEYNFKNSVNYKWGQSLYSSFFISKHLHFRYEWLTENWTAILQFRHEFRSHNYNYNLSNPQVKGSGGHLIYLVPQINYTIKEKWNLSFLFDLPVYRYYNETQLANSFAVTFNITKDFLFTKQ